MLTDLSRGTLCHRLARLGREKPEALACTELDGQGQSVGSLTYGELAARTARFANGLARRGLRGERVVLALPNGLDFTATFLACLWAGAIPVAVIPPRRESGWRHLQAVADDCQARLLVSPKPSEHGSLPSLKPAQLEGPEEEALSAADPDSIAFLQYTSGSTSAPKGVIVTHANLAANADLMQRLQEQPEGCTIVSWLPVYHDMGLVACVLQSVHLGGHVVLMSPAAFLWRPYLWLKAVSDYRAHTSGAPNFAYQLVMERTQPQERAVLDLSPWKSAFCGAEPVRRSTVEGFCQAFAASGFDAQAFHPCFGLAEATLCVSMRTRPEQLPAFTENAGYANCGVALAPTQIAILEPGGQRPLPDGEVGEIVVRGPSVSPGYWGRPPRGEMPLRTGDLGFILAGQLFVSGRLKDLIILEGRNIHPEDLEGTVQDCLPILGPGRCAAFALEQPEGEKLIVAVEARRPERLPMERAIRKAIGEQHEVAVDHVVFLKPGGLPRTSSGKVRRGACAQAVAELCREDLELARATGDPVESYLCRALAAEARVPQFSPTDTFDGMGVSSLFRFTLMGELAYLLSADVPGDATWRYPTPRDLAQAVRQGFPEGVEPLSLGTGIPLIVLCDVSSGLKWFEHVLAAMPPGHTILGLHPPPGASTLEELAAPQAELLTSRYGHGPFAVVGYSHHGRLAFEVARQLTRAGTLVPLVVSVDGTSRSAFQLSPQELWRQFRTRLFQQGLGVLRQAGWSGLLSGVGKAGHFLWRWLLQRLVGRRIAPRQKSEPSTPDVMAFRRRVGRAGRYRPTPYPGTLLVYRAPSRSFSSLHSPGAGWADLALGGVEIVDVGGDHFGMVKPPHAAILAADLSRRLKQLR